MKKFLESYHGISNYAERIKFGIDDYNKIKNKANKYGLPIALLFTSKVKSTTSTSIKWLSTEYRRRILIVEIPPVPKNNQLRKEIIGSFDNYDDDDDLSSLPALYIIPPSLSSSSSSVVGGSNNDDNDGTETNIIKYNNNDYKRRKLQDFFNIHSLKESVYEPIIITTNNNSTSTKEKDEEEHMVNDKKKQSVGGSGGGDEF